MQKLKIDTANVLLFVGQVTKLNNYNLPVISIERLSLSLEGATTDQPRASSYQKIRAHTHSHSLSKRNLIKMPKHKMQHKSCPSIY